MLAFSQIDKGYVLHCRAVSMTIYQQICDALSGVRRHLVAILLSIFSLRNLVLRHPLCSCLACVLSLNDGAEVISHI